LGAAFSIARALGNELVLSIALFGSGDLLA
jgi:hypothetical protein